MVKRSTCGIVRWELSSANQRPFRISGAVTSAGTIRWKNFVFIGRTPPAFAEMRRCNPVFYPNPRIALARAAATKQTVQIAGVSRTRSISIRCPVSAAHRLPRSPAAGCRTASHRCTETQSSSSFRSPQMPTRAERACCSSARSSGVAFAAAQRRF